MEDKICICVDYKYKYLVFGDINTFCSVIKKSLDEFGGRYYFDEDIFFTILLTTPKVKLAGKKTEIREKEMENSYICDIISGFNSSIVVADKNGKVIFNIN